MKKTIKIEAYGTRISQTGERLVISFPKENPKIIDGKKQKEYVKQEHPAREIDKILICKPASLTSPAVDLALRYGIDIAFLGYYDMPFGRIVPSSPGGLATLRHAQLEVSKSEKSLDLAKAFVKGKCSNQISYLRHLGYKYKKDLSKQILNGEDFFAKIDLIPPGPKSKEQLLGIEGFVAKNYFLAIKKFFSFPGRIPQGLDKFNSALNYGYGILRNEMEKNCQTIGLDPFLGIYHTERYGKMPIVYDLMEEFRVPVVDAAIFPLFIEKKMKNEYFEKTAPKEYRLSAEGKYLISRSVQSCLNQDVLWRRKHWPLKSLMNNQVESLARYFMGKQKKYDYFNAEAIFLLDE